MSLFKISSLFILFTNLLFAYPHYSNAVKVKKLYPMGEKIYEKRCPSLELNNYKEFDALEEDIIDKKVCGSLSQRYADAVLLYLWEVKRANAETKHYAKLTVSKTDKCPVCGMFLYKYPRWVARIEYGNKKLSFDGVKDMMKYYFKHKKNIRVMLVQDYYSQETINAKEAYYVIGSDVYGPMGNELIAFKDKKEAKRFALDHRAKKILSFDAITPNIVYALDE